MTKAFVKVSVAMGDRKGVTSLEYGVVAAALIAAVTAGMSVLSSNLEAAFTTLGLAIRSAF
ncbi:MAG: Flp family type IVb pilin [Alphaproteobacteria bacterium]|nr:Flp family type IVb pilin [Alphaproteobacteria bacterium]